MQTSYKTLRSETQFLKMVGANIVNRLGDSLDLIAFQWIVYQITQSPVWIAVISGFNFLPNLVLQPIAGVLVERMNKKRVMILCDIGRGCITLSVAVMLLTNTLNPWILILITMLNSSFESFRMPAAIAIRPKILEKEKFSIGIGLDQSISRIVELMGFGIAGFIVAVSPVIAVLIDCASFIVSAVIISFIKYKETVVEITKSFSGFFNDFSNGLKYINQKRVVMYLIIWAAVTNISAAAIMSFQAVYVADYLMLDAKFLSWMSIVSTFGMSLGALAAPKLRSKIKGYILLTLDGVLIALVYIALAYIPSMGLSSAAAAVCALTAMLINGFSGGACNVIYSSMLLENLDEEFMSRVAGVFGAANALTIPLSSFMMAGLAAVYSVPALFFISAGITAATYGTALIFKEFRKI